MLPIVERAPPNVPLRPLPENVPATFFIIGKNGQAYPDLMHRIANEGHEIGNHTFTHPNLGEIPLSLTELELNATQRLIESEIGRSTVLFRPPYFGDAEADKPEERDRGHDHENLGDLLVRVPLQQLVARCGIGRASCRERVSSVV